MERRARTAGRWYALRQTSYGMRDPRRLDVRSRAGAASLRPRAADCGCSWAWWGTLTCSSCLPSPSLSFLTRAWLSCTPVRAFLAVGCLARLGILVPAGDCLPRLRAHSFLGWKRLSSLLGSFTLVAGFHRRLIGYLSRIWDPASFPGLPARAPGLPLFAACLPCHNSARLSSHLPNRICNPFPYASSLPSDGPPGVRTDQT